MSKKIREMYRKAGLKPPDGKGIHTERFHECVIALTKALNPVDNPYAVCMAKLGRDKSVKKSHRKKK